MKRLIIALVLFAVAVSLAPNRNPDHPYNEHWMKAYGENGGTLLTAHSITLDYPLDLATGLLDTVTLQWSGDTTFDNFNVYFDSLSTPTTQVVNGGTDEYFLIDYCILSWTYYWYVVGYLGVDSVVSATYAFTALTPWAIDSTKLFLDAEYGCYRDSALTPCEDGDAVLYWYSRVAGGIFYYQTSLAYRPIYNTDGNGDHYLAFNGSSQYMYCSSTTFLNNTITIPYTVWSRMAFGSNQPNNSTPLIAKFGNDGSGTYGGWAVGVGVLGNPSYPGMTWWTLAGVGVKIVYSTATATTSVVNYSFLWHWDGVSSYELTAEQYWENVLKADAKSVAGGVGTWTTTHGSTIGKIYDGSVHLLGSVYTIAYYKRQLSTGEIGQLKLYGDAR
jgi:hypothetical protein